MHCPGAFQRGCRLGAAQRADITRDFSAFFHHDFSVADFPRHFPCRVDDEVLARGEFTFEAAVDFGDIDPLVDLLQHHKKK